MLVKRADINRSELPMTAREKRIMQELIEAARPFTEDTTVTETSGTIPLMYALEQAIEAAKNLLEEIPIAVK